MPLALLFHYLMLNMFRVLVHPSSVACDLLWIYFICCIAMVRCVLVLRCGILMQAEAHLQELATYCGFISCVVLLWFDVCWCYGVVRLGWCGIVMQAEA